MNLEQILRCHIRTLDSDGDGFPDVDEIYGTPGTDPFDSADNSNNVRDSDGDGCSDYDEINFDGFCDANPNTPMSDAERRINDLVAACPGIPAENIAVLVEGFDALKQSGTTFGDCFIGVNISCTDQVCQSCGSEACRFVFGF